MGAARIDVPLTGRAGPAWLIDQIGNRFVASTMLEAIACLPNTLIECLRERRDRSRTHRYRYRRLASDCRPRAHPGIHRHPWLVCAAL